MKKELLLALQQALASGATSVGATGQTGSAACEHTAMGAIIPACEHTAMGVLAS